MSKLLKLVSCFSLLMILSACADKTFTQFYRSNFDCKNIEQVNLQKAECFESIETPKIVDLNNREQVVNYLSKRYIIVGETSFNGIIKNDILSIQKAKEVGASLILRFREYTNTEASQGYVYNPYLGNIPYTNHNRRYDQSFYFLTKSNYNYKFGMMNAELDENLRKKYQTNTGMYVSYVIEDTPCFYANILRGDIIKKFNDEEIISSKDASDILRSFNGSEAVFDVLRDGKYIKIKVTL